MTFQNRIGAGALLLGASLVALAGAAPAAEVTLRVKGGGLEIKGEVRAFDGEKYVIESPSIGLMTFNTQRIECIGEACGRRVAPPVPQAERLNPAQPDTVTIAGTSALGQGLMPALIRGYATSIGASATQVVGGTPAETRFRIVGADNAELATFVVKSQATTAALDAVAQKSATIGLAERAIDDAEAVRLFGGARAPARAEHEHLIGSDGLAVIVSPANPTIALTQDLIAKIFAGQITDWFQLGGKNGAIALYGLDRSSGALAALESQLLRPRGLTLAPAIKELASDSDVSDAVAREPFAIGLTSFAFVRNARRLNVESACGLIARPTSFAVKAGEYALTRPLYLYTAGQPTEPAARGLIRYALSPAAQGLISEADFIDQTIESLPIDEQKERMAHALNAPPLAFDMDQMRQLLADLKGARRLSMTFRFTRGTIDLDARSRRDVVRLAGLLQSPEYAGKTVLLAGFTDAEAKLSLMTTFALKRAAQVRAAVLTAGGPGNRIAGGNLQAKGYGPIAPLFCNDSPDHKQLNRRVEVWVRD